jgi:hypothetical protein
MATAPRIGTPEHKAVDLLKKTRMFHLDQQQRSINQTHTEYQATHHHGLYSVSIHIKVDVTLSSHQC